MKYGAVLLLLILVSCKEDDAPSWKTWKVEDEPVFEGQFSLVGDPSVLKTGNTYCMYYTGFDPYRDPQGPDICQATSSDGKTWTNVSVAGAVEGRMLFTSSNSWSNAHETSYALKHTNQFLLYFIGYQDTGGGIFGSGSVSIGLATSTDGESFTQAQATPVIEPTPGGLDRDAISSPSIITYQDSLLMIYAGFCYIACGAPVISNLLVATSQDGIVWIKKNTPIISREEIPWASAGVAEAELVAAPDGMYYLFMTSIDEPHVIGVAIGKTPFGPWEVNPNPIIKTNKSFSGEGAVAPSVIIEGKKVRLWYHGFSTGKILIGYAETTWPLKN